MSVKTLMTWECDRCGFDEHTEVGTVPEGWRGVGATVPVVDPADNFVDYRALSKHDTLLLCPKCMDDLIGNDFILLKAPTNEADMKQYEKNLNRVTEPDTSSEDEQQSEPNIEADILVSPVVPVDPSEG